MTDKKDILSQEEIDALMPKVDEQVSAENKTLSSEEKDVLGEIGNIAMGSAATALYTLLDQKVEITTPKVNVSTFKDISQEYDRPCVLVKVSYIEGIAGTNLLIIKDEDAAVIADLMMGGDGNNPEQELDEIQLSAVAEAMNQMMGSAATSLSSIINAKVNISPPETKYLTLEDAIDGGEVNFAQDELLVDTSFRLKIGDLVDSNFKQLAPLPFTKKLVARLLDVEQSGGLTAKDQAAASREEVVEARIEARDSTPGSALRSRSSRTDNISQDTVGVKRVQFPDFDSSTPAPLPQNMELIQDVPLKVTVQLGKTKMTIKEILDLGEGSIIELDKLAGEPVDLLVNGKLVAKGEVVVIDENFGFRVKDIISPLDRLNNI